MNSNFNRQFIMIDFRLLEDRRFLRFLGSSEFATYLVLRRHVWRGEDTHYMGLQDLYLQDRKLTCSLEREKIAEITEVRPNQISLHLSKLEQEGVLQRIRTGRQSIFVLGEWIDVYGDGSYKGIEWFYLDGKYGVSKSDVVKEQRSETRKSGDQTSANSGDQTSARFRDQTSANSGDNNIYNNTEENSVHNGLIKQLKNLRQSQDKTAYLSQHLLSELGDKHSERFYNMVAAKVPEDVIYTTLAEVRADGAINPAKLFTYKINRYALEQVKKAGLSR
jgi:DNA-binding transcriptional ArsR family regulator